MFERNRVDNVSGQRKNTADAELRLTDGRVLSGRIAMPSTRQIFDELNADGGFLDFTPYHGPRELIAKATVAAVRPLEVPRAARLSATAGADDFDPYRVLNISPEAGLAEVREAYHRISKLYHPDRYSNTDLPPEVSDYIHAMSRRINAAFSALEKPFQAQREMARYKSEPIYQRG